MCLPSLGTFGHGLVVVVGAVVVFVAVVAGVVVALFVVLLALSSTWLSPIDVAICNELINVDKSFIGYGFFSVIA